jgi:hypothetical protein
MSGKGRVDAVACAIERYVGVNPAAADTASGIRSWWLPEELRTEPLSTVVAALDLLEARHVVARIAREGGAVIYSARGPAPAWRH